MRLGSFQSVHEPFVEPTPEDEPIDLVGDSESLLYVRRRMAQVAPTNATVLLLGETGTGKGVAARLIHHLSPRRDGRFISVDCASIPGTLIESELFGREKGAFTDARSTQVGRCELAHGGTLFLDEIGEVPADIQSKLLRILQYGQFERLGSPRTIRVDVRIIAATNRSLIDDVKAGRFRRDLYYRLNVFPITMPPLRERPCDLPALATYLIARLARKHHRHIDAVPREAFERLAAYDWPGNVREFENVLERAIITSPDTTLELAEVLTPDTAEAFASPTNLMVDVERTHILRMLHASEWRIEGPHGAARALGMKPSTLRSRMRRLGVTRLRRASAPAHVS
jgi:transcriptional regulator with GAF, ATPase, and Fis domain